MLFFQIDEESPFFEMTPQSLLSSQFEIVVVMEGVTEETGNTVQGHNNAKSGGIGLVTSVVKGCVSVSLSHATFAHV